MSGQPYRYATDPEKYRSKYMEQLQQRAQLDDTVLQAVKNYVATGTIPPISQIPDTRTTSEKLLDVEKLKQGIIKDLEPIMDYPTAEALVQGLSRSPLNTDNKLVIFMAQAGAGLIEQIKKIYKTGIRGDANDIAVFVDKINNAYVKFQEGANSVKSLIESGYGSGTMPLKNDYDAYASEFSRIKAQIVPTLNRRAGIMAQAMPIITSILDKLKVISRFIPDSKEFQNLEEFISNTNAGDPALDRMTNAVEFLRTDMPKKYVIQGLFNQLTKSDVSDTQIVDILIKLDSILPTIVDVNRFIGNDSVQKVFTSKVSASAPSQQPNPNPFQADYSDVRQDIERIKRDFMLQGFSPQLGQRLAGIITDMSNRSGIQVQTYAPNHPNITEGEVEPIINKIDTDLRRSGSGIIKRRGRPRGSGIKIPIQHQIEKGVEPSKKYIEFGKYIIHSPKLNENILSLKTKNGTHIPDFPVLQMSKNLSSVMKTIVGGKIPSFEDMSKLSEEERNYLYKVSKKANIMDKVNIPTPSKDQEEKDMHQFEVMKGEIMSGNDSQELIKKFKLLLLRLSKSGRLNKSQVTEIMEDLLSIGY